MDHLSTSWKKKDRERSFDSGDTPSTAVTRIALGESLVFSGTGDRGRDDASLGVRNL